VPYRDMLADPETVMNRYIELGCRYIVVPIWTKRIAVPVQTTKG
jgi:hypothetical protein